MGWLNDWWNNGNSPPKPKPPAKIESYDVGKIYVRVSYLDVNDKLAQSAGYVFGYCKWDANPPLGQHKVVKVYAEGVLFDWLRRSNELGVFDVNNHFIPRERVRDIFTLPEEEHMFDVHYEPRPKDN